MINLKEEENKKVRCLLVYNIEDDDAMYHTNELQGLTNTLGLETVHTEYVRIKKIQPRYILGSGKAEEIATWAEETESDCIVFDFQISPTQQRNWERLANIPVYDREEIILRIFASRAQTKEAVLQVELARLQYSLPRLAHSYGDMARQRGGNYGSKGSGETQLELDRRAILQKIALIKSQLEKVAKERQVQEKRREKTGAYTCAIVGYTNAGKSSLLNALTGADSFVQDALFATLDPTTRKLSVNGSVEILLSDTVGFIRNLPHTLVKSFRSTLEQASNADLILILLDASDMHFESQYQTTLEVLSEIGAEHIPKILVCNKIDAIETNIFLKQRVESFCNEYKASYISAKTKSGFENLRERIITELIGELKTYSIPLVQTSIEPLIRKHGCIKNAEWRDDCVVVEAWLPKRIQEALSEFLT